jgi:hypothetical protein
MRINYTVGAPHVLVSANPVLSVAGTYAASDYVGTSSVPMTFAVARVDGGSGRILAATLVDAGSQHIAGKLFLWDTLVTPPLDNAAHVVSLAHAKTNLGMIQFTTYFVGTGNYFCPVYPTMPIPFVCLVGSRNIYGTFMTDGTPSYTSLDLTFRLIIEQS